MKHVDYLGLFIVVGSLSICVSFIIAFLKIFNLVSGSWSLILTPYGLFFWVSTLIIVLGMLGVFDAFD